MQSIRARFLIFIIPVVAISFIFLAVILTMLSIDRLEEQSIEKIHSSNDYLQKNINNWLTFQTGLLSSIEEMNFSQKLNTNEQRINNNVILESINTQLGYRNIALVGANGKALLAGNKKRVGADYGKMDYLIKALKQPGDIIISDVRFSRVDGTPLISFAKSLVSGHSIFTSVPLENLYKDYVQTNRNDDSNYSFILTSNCEPLAHPVMENNKFDYSKLCTEQELVNFEENGENYVASISQNPLTRWYVVSATNVKIINSITTEVISTAVLISVIALIVVLATIYILTKSISQRINRIVLMLDFASNGNMNKLQEYKVELSNLAIQEDEVGKIAVATERLIKSQEEKVLFAKKIADGDLQGELSINQEDTLGQSLNQMSKKLKNLIEQLINVVDKVDDTMVHLSKRSEDLQSGVIEQRSAVEGISDRVSLLKKHINEQGGLVDNIHDRAGMACQEAEDNKSQMQDMIISLEKINDSGENISGIMGNISSIAEQTNLIALNAAIEAARAGEHGRGFAVVADEVRNLAARSGEAASQTSQLVKTSLDAIAVGKHATDGTEKAFLQVVSHVSDLSKSMETIKSFSMEQISTMIQVSTDLSKVEMITEENNELSENLSNQCCSLKSLTERLQSEIHQFKL